ncbi:metal homeostatis protein Bsd2p [[Candida] anglica]|uniref:Metal homeostatis protein Bsd2p n=1 Tax=[Candida] anglica TaxID=148631 RepID=A0ABP0EPP2_9ASCO
MTRRDHQQGVTELSEITSGRDDANESLLKSFDTPEPGTDFEGSTSFGQGTSEDNRLLQPEYAAEDHGGTSASDIDRNIHDAIIGSSSVNNHEYDVNQYNLNNGGGGSSSNTHLPSSLESRQPNTGLTRKQRIMNVLNHVLPLRQTYERINNGLTTGRMQANIPGNFVGQGTDGVFRNLMAKPDTDSNRQEQEIHPPTYDEAAADATPEYWESTVISPMYEDEVFVEGLPVGNVANFVWNGLVTVAFQFIGFVLCYLLHTSHAAKQGSRTGLGITFIIYGYSMIPSNFGHADQLPDKFVPDDPNLINIDKGVSISKGGKIDNYSSGLFHQGVDDPSVFENRTPYFAYAVIAFGLFMIMKALADYLLVKQIERSILSPNQGQQQTHSITEEIHDNDEDSRQARERIAEQV